MRVLVWDFKNKEYKAREIPDEWKATTYCADLNAEVNCAECGRVLTYGECYTSRRIHNKIGMGFGVCPECYDIEMEKERVFWKQ